jgi:RNA polymerase sigma-70 factor, ECF subfamily
MVQPAVRKSNLAALDDAELVRRAIDRDAGALAAIMQRHNQRLYRIARSVLRNSAEAEDAV